MNRKKLEAILQKRVERIDAYQHHWIVYDANQQKWMAKNVDSEHLQWWLQIDRELRSRGFLRMPPMRTDGVSLVLTPWIKGKIGSYRNLNQTVHMMKQLALFHQAGAGLQTPPKQEVAFLLYHRLYKRLRRFYRVLCKIDQLPSEIGKLLRQEGFLFYQDGYQAWQQLIQLPIQAHTDWNRYHNCLAHRDLASHNWIIDEQKRIWLIDFDTADYDSQLGDLWQMLTRILSEHNWDEQVFVRLLTRYESIRPLDPLEKQLLVTLLRFPNEFFREAIGLCLNKPGYVYRSTFPYLRKLAKSRQHWLMQTARFASW